MISISQNRTGRRRSTILLRWLGYFWCAIIRLVRQHRHQLPTESFRHLVEMQIIVHKFVAFKVRLMTVADIKLDILPDLVDLITHLKQTTLRWQRWCWWWWRRQRRQLWRRPWRLWWWWRWWWNMPEIQLHWDDYDDKGADDWVSACRDVVVAGRDLWAGAWRLGECVWKMTWNCLSCSLNGQCSGMCGGISYMGQMPNPSLAWNRWWHIQIQLHIWTFPKGCLLCRHKIKSSNNGLGIFSTFFSERKSILCYHFVL